MGSLSLREEGWGEGPGANAGEAGHADGRPPLLPDNRYQSNCSRLSNSRRSPVSGSVNSSPRANSLSGFE